MWPNRSSTLSQSTSRLVEPKVLIHPTGHTLLNQHCFQRHFKEITLNQCGIDVELTSLPSGMGVIFSTERVTHFKWYFMYLKVVNVVICVLTVCVFVSVLAIDSLPSWEANWLIVLLSSPGAVYW